MSKYQALQKYFGYDSFREGQECLVDGILAGHDALGIMPTGGGKSLCYQLPATLLDGLTIVISPLISLMKDQVDALTEIGIPATFINSSLTDHEFRGRVTKLFHQHYKILYVAPERLNSGLFRSLVNQVPVALVAIDEAHCISKWGHDFRPSYSAIPHFIHTFQQRPVVAAYTATATPEVIHEIKQLLDLHNPIESIIGFDRPNLTYEVLKIGDKLKYIERFIRNHYPKDAGIIYCATRKAVESVTQLLAAAKFSVASYHGGMDNEMRAINQTDFLRDKIRIIVATNAFGMGIDKPNVRFVIHYNMPQNMEAYYQEAGRAGRDGASSHCLLLYSPSDIAKQKFLIESQETQIEPERKTLLYRNLQYLIDYCHTDECLRAQILKYFAETPTTTCCNNCSNCTDTSQKVEITLEAQKILSCIYRIEQRYGLNMVLLVLRGSRDQRVLDNALHHVSTYGLMKDYSEKSLREMIMTLISRNYIHQTIEAYPTLRLTEKARAVLKGEATIYHRKHLLDPQPRPARTLNKMGPSLPADFDHALFEQLRALRAEIAKEKSLPAFVVFNDATLQEMTVRKPRNKGHLLTVKGVGERKYEAYGEKFITLIVEYSAAL